MKDWGAGHVRGKRTLNISIKFVTLDVLKLSGWLNCFAACRVDGRGMRRKARRARAGRRGS